MKKVLFLICGIIFISTLNAYSASTIVVNGLPIVKVISGIEGTELVKLSNEQSFSYRLLITKRGNKYYWASREDKELQFNQSGSFYNFVEPNGAGYVRIAKTKENFLYMEHLTLGFKNITYWGVVEEFSIE